jgi:hypothetical protein
VGTATGRDNLGLVEQRRLRRLATRIIRETSLHFARNQSMEFVVEFRKKDVAAGLLQEMEEA